jgi:oligopeptide/dipeptide ABC transporter ATP-binding protein
MSTQLLEIHDLRTYFYTEDGIVKAINGADLTLNKGEVLGLVGESGCGKSTLAYSVMRLIPKPGKIEGGSIKFLGKDLLELKDAEMREIRGGLISMIFQDPMSSLNPVYTIGDQVAEAVRVHQKLTDNKEIKEKVIEMLDKVGITDPEMRFTGYPHEFSGGMRQRVMIAMALSCQPKLLIADEPTTSLDVTIQAQILDLLRSLRKEFDTSILLITHNLGIVAELCEKVAIMYAGKIVEYGESVNIFKNPQHPYTKALINSIPRIDIVQDRLETIQGNVPSLIDLPKGCNFAPRCPYAAEECTKVEPELHDLGQGHLAACIRLNEINSAK